MFDPSTFDGDYREAWQVWYYKHKCSTSKILETFKDEALIIIIGSNPPRDPPSGWMRFRKAMEDHFDRNGREGV